MPYLIAISIGPVQDFIAAARKTRDLWFGSEMLCSISREVAKVMPPEGLIFPTKDSLTTDDAVANKILAIIDGNPKEYEEKARGAAQKCLIGFFDAAKKSVTNKGLSSSIRPDLAKDQLAHFLEFYVAWWPINESYNYGEARLQVDRLLAGRKAARDFSPACGVEGVPKSSLDGGRESVLKPELVKTGCVALGIKKGEQLDGISLIKRIADPKRFVSVSRVAIDPLIRRFAKDANDDLAVINEKALQLAGTDLVQKFKGFDNYRPFPFDTQLFYGDTEQNKDATEDEKGLASAFFLQVRSVCKRLKISEPSPYFAVLVADGDNMGKVINNLGTPEGHRAFSQELAKFAQLAKNIVDTHYGAMVYSGGDDVLAFLPLDKALECADALQKEFKMTGGTLSCGISIAHFNEHLQHLLRWGRTAERAAKEHPGKNALAIHLHTRTAGDEAVCTASSWDDDPVDKYRKLTSLLFNDLLPVGSIYELRKLAKEWKRLDISGAYHDEFKCEVLRIIERKMKQHGTMVLDQTTKDIILDAAGTPESLKKLIDALIIAKKFVDIQRVTGMEGQV